MSKLCQKTGSNPAPSQPLLEDAENDDGFNLDVLHDMEPIETPFNELVHPQDRMTSRAEGSVPSSSSCNIIWSSSPIFYTSVSDNKILHLCIQAVSSIILSLTDIWEVFTRECAINGRNCSKARRVQ